MNGRIYDSHLGRFLQADPVIQAPGNAQNHNRYSYVLNNPLSFSDPSGFSFWTKWRSTIVAAIAYAITFVLTTGCELCAQTVANAVRAGMDAHQAGTNVGRAILNSTVGSILGGRVLGGAITTALNGGIRRQIGAALTAGVVGEVLGSSNLPSFAATAASGCISALAGGGNCGRGAGDALISMGINMAAQAAAEYVLAAHRAGSGARTIAGNTGMERQPAPSFGDHPEMQRTAIYSDTFDSDGNRMISVPIQFRGGGASSDYIAAVITTTQSMWSGTYFDTDRGREISLTVKVVQVSEGGNIMYMGGFNDNPFKENIAPGLWYLGGRGGFVSTFSESTFVIGRIGAHEVGHLFSLSDGYLNGRPMPGYESTIMGNAYLTESAARWERGCIGRAGCNVNPGN
jgi:hypothetical protein